MISGLRAPQRLETTHRLTSIRLSPSAWPTCVHGLLGHHRLRTPLRRWRFGRCVSDMPVDGGSADAELGGDLGHRVGVYRPHRPRDTPPGVTATRRETQLRVWPPVRAPRARAAASPSLVRLDTKACSNSAIAPRIWKKIRPTTVEASMP